MEEERGCAAALSDVVEVRLGSAAAAVPRFHQDCDLYGRVLRRVLGPLHARVGLVLDGSFQTAPRAGHGCGRRTTFWTVDGSIRRLVHPETAPACLARLPGSI